MTGPSRILIVCEGHAALLGGGFEPLFAAALRDALVEGGDEAWLLAGVPRPDPGFELRGAITQPLGARDFVCRAGSIDPFTLSNADAAFPEAFAALLDELKPDVVHFWGLKAVGPEAIASARRRGVRTVLTLTDASAVCAADGALRTRTAGEPCAGPSLSACATCFPERGPTGLYLRQAFLDRFIRSADAVTVISLTLAAALKVAGRTRGGALMTPLAPLLRRDSRGPGAGDGVLRVGIFGAGAAISALPLGDLVRRLEAESDQNVRLILQPLDAEAQATAPQGEGGCLEVQPLRRGDELLAALDGVDLVLSSGAADQGALLEAARARRIPCLTPLDAPEDHGPAAGVSLTGAPGRFDPLALANQLRLYGALPYLLTAPEGTPEDARGVAGRFRGIYAAADRA